MLLRLQPNMVQNFYCKQIIDNPFKLPVYTTLLGLGQQLEATMALEFQVHSTNIRHDINNLIKRVNILPII